MKLALTLSLAACLLFVPRRNKVSFHFALNHTNHTEVFQLLSRPENFPILNPTIYRLRVHHTTRSHNSKDRQEFFINYDECLSTFPAVTNSAVAHYMILRNVSDDSHEMISSHSTCFAGKFICLPTESRLRISTISQTRVSYEEYITYSCPWLLGKFCLDEILFQRRAIMTGLEDAIRN